MGVVDSVMSKDAVGHPAEWAVRPICGPPLATARGVVYPARGRRTESGGKRDVSVEGRDRGARAHGDRSGDRGGDRGSALVEAAIILPVVALMIFGIVEIGFLFRSATIVSTSSRSGARLAAAQYGSASGTTAQNTVM